MLTTKEIDLPLKSRQGKWKPNSKRIPTTWPEMYGFTVTSGTASCYVTSVERRSPAHLAGICPGDQIVEVEGRNVADMSADNIRALAKLCQGNARESVDDVTRPPPKLGVVSRVQYLELAADADPAVGFGLTMTGVRPTIVQEVQRNGPADKAGIRPGDIVLEIDGRVIRSESKLTSLLTSSHTTAGRTGIVTLAMIAVDTGEKTKMATGRSADLLLGGDSNGPDYQHQAHVLFEKMNDLLENDFQKKMALVGLMKQYAENRDIDTFAKALTVLLDKPKHHLLFDHIRSYVPQKQRAQFEAAIKPILQRDVKQPDNDGHHASSASISRARSVTVVRSEDGSFGFVLRGSDPVCIESVLTDSPASQAGLTPGDCILTVNSIDVRKATHDHLIKVLQHSGRKPTLQVVNIKKMLHRSSSTDSVGSSSSRSSSIDMTNAEQLKPLEDLWLTSGDKESVGPSNDRVRHVLTESEKTAVRRALRHFQQNKDIGQLVNRLDVVLDNGQKKSLWPLLMSRLNKDQRDYVMKYADLPEQWTRKVGASNNVKTGNKNTARKLIESSDSDKDSLFSWSSDSDNDNHKGQNQVVTGTFKQKIGILLTSSERLLLIDALQNYNSNRNVHHLMDDVMDILSTPSKATLWTYIIPLLTAPHQEFCQQMLGFPVKQQDRRNGSSPLKEKSSGSVPEASSRSSPLKPSATPRRGDVIFDGFSATKQPGREDKKYRKSRGRQNLSTSRHDDDDDSDDDRDEESPSEDSMPRFFYGRKTASPDDPRRKNFGDVTQSVVPDGEQMSRRRVVMVRESEAQTTPSTTPIRTYRQLTRASNATSQFDATLASKSHSDERKSHSTESTSSFGEFRTVVNLYGSDSQSATRNKTEILSVYNERGPEAGLTSQSHDSRSILHRGRQGDGQPSITSQSSGAQTSSDDIARMTWTLTEETRDVLRALDEAVDGVSLDANDTLKSASRQPTSSSPPPAPPLPLQALTSVQKLPFQPALGVKRINWEKLEKVDENTVWAKIQDGDDVQEVVNSLDLEQQFSTKKSSITETFKDQRKTDIGILSAKKAYNISILLGHMKKDAGDVKKALLSSDDDGDTLTPECIKQLLDYAPDTNEMEKFDEYRGLMDDLSKPDQFTYQVTRIPGYHQRLRAMMFKSNFTEKVEEVKTQLRCLKKASQEVRNSEKLSKVLELVLAMGNQLNKGNARIGDAPGFKISVLSQLDQTKTSDGKVSFLHVLASAVYSRFPDAVDLQSDLPTVPDAAKVSNKQIAEELNELRRVLKEISDTVNKMVGTKQRAGPNDHFYEVMEHFIARASDEIQTLFSLHVTTAEEFHHVVEYFGENPRETTSVDWFNNLAVFLAKFEKAHQQNNSQKQSIVRAAALHFDP